MADSLGCRLERFLCAPSPILVACRVAERGKLWGALGDVDVPGRTPGVFSSFVGVTVEVSDWPLPELERFKSQRPKLYAEMKTRLMAVAPVTQLTPDVVEQKCAEFARLRAQGKVQNVPPACSASPVPKGSPRT